jgi:hypothetical protein
MISISNMVASSSYGNVIIQEDADKSDLKTKTARVSRTATLDGGVYINHSGIADGDRTLRIQSVISRSQEDILEYMYATQTFIIVAISDGVFEGAIETLNSKNGILKMNILVKSRLN